MTGIPGRRLATSRGERCPSPIALAGSSAAQLAVLTMAAGIGYAIERDWLIISGGLHSVSLTEAGRRRVK